jgi:predicted GIY-YIG superfamily endonuclease
MNKNIKRKPDGYWTKENCLKKALKYKSRTKFHIESSSAYTSAYNNGWLNSICKHIIPTRKPDGYWTKNRCIKEAKRFKSKTEFKYNSTSAFQSARRNDWLPEICSHMVELLKPAGYWTKKRCQEEAAKYQIKNDFRNGSSKAYMASHRNKWINDVCKHMEIQGNHFFVFVYVFEFTNNAAYIGLTYNIKERELDHLSRDKSQVYKHIKKTRAKYTLKIITKKPITKDKAQELEHKMKLKYIREGWNVLNKGKTGKGIGSLGGNTLFWTKERCHQEALKYNLFSEFCKKASGAYDSAQRNGWVNDIRSHMTELRKPVGYWNKRRCKEEAFKYTKRSIFQRESNSAYNIAWRNGWINSICKHMK